MDLCFYAFPDGEPVPTSREDACLMTFRADWERLASPPGGSRSRTATRVGSSGRWRIWLRV